MRLTQYQLKEVIDAFSENFLPQDTLFLFGSRVDDSKKGGDIDLYIETHCQNWTIVAHKQLDFLVALKKKIGEQKIDVVINLLNTHANRPIYQTAKNTGIRIR